MARRIELEVVVLDSPEAFAGTIQGVEQLEQRTVGLTSRTVELRKELAALRETQATLDKELETGKLPLSDHIQLSETLGRRQTDVAAALKQSQFAQLTARQELQNLNFASRDAAQQAQLLAAQFGVHLPAGMTETVARIGGVQRAMKLAFNATIVVGVGAAIVALLPKIAQWIDMLRGVQGENDEILAQARETNQLFAPTETVQDAGERLSRLQRRQRELQERTAFSRDSGDIFTKFGPARLPVVTEQFKKDREELATLPGLIEKANQLVLDLEKKRRDKSAELAEKAAAEERERSNAILDQKFAQSQFEDDLIASGTDLLEQQMEERSQINLKFFEMHEAQLEEHRKLNEQYAKDREAAAEHLAQLEANAAIAGLEPRQKALAQIGQAEEQRIAALDKLYLSEEEYQRARVALATDAEAQRMDVMRQAAEEQQRLIEQQGRDWEFLFDRITGGAKSVRDVLNNVFREIAREAKSQIFQDLARVASGQGVGNAGGGAATGQPSGGTASLGSILGSVFGGGGFGGGGAVGATPPFIPSSGFLSGTNAPGSIAGFGGANQAAGFPGGVTTVGTQPTTAASLGLPSTTPLGDLLSLGSPRGIGGVPSGAVTLGALTLGSLTIGNRSRLLSTLGGAGTGALIGFQYGGPIGAGVGALIGAGIGFFAGGSGPDKRHDTEIQQAGERAMFAALEDFERHRIDFTRATQTVESAFEQMTAQFQRPESRRIPQINRDNILARIREIEDERNRRRELLALQALPEFHEGGLVGNREQGIGNSREIPAMLQAGEFVMSSAAVRRLGVSLLEGLNQGTGSREQGTGGGYSIQVWVPSKEFAAEIVEKGIPVVLGKGGRASRILRG